MQDKKWQGDWNECNVIAHFKFSMQMGLTLFSISDLRENL